VRVKKERMSFLNLTPYPLSLRRGGEGKENEKSE
jgi:hypothetical protein